MASTFHDNGFSSKGFHDEGEIESLDSRQRKKDSIEEKWFDIQWLQLYFNSNGLNRFFPVIFRRVSLFKGSIENSILKMSIYVIF